MYKLQITKMKGLLFIIIMMNLRETFGHGMVMDPVNRGSAWRRGFDTPVNWDDDGNYCGGFSVHYNQNNGKCGVCGDNYSDEQPRANENGGEYGTGKIVKTYIEGQEFEVDIEITANHMGTFEFSLCQLQNETDIETEECFQNNPIKLKNGDDNYILTSDRVGSFKIDLVLPEGITCQHCSFRWHWKVANSWGLCDDGIQATGCGDQETFRSCSDIAIEGKNYDPPSEMNRKFYIDDYNRLEY